jgi:hypothetical protein
VIVAKLDAELDLKVSADAAVPSKFKAEVIVYVSVDWNVCIVPAVCDVKVTKVHPSDPVKVELALVLKVAKEKPGAFRVNVLALLQVIVAFETIVPVVKVSALNQVMFPEKVIVPDVLIVKGFVIAFGADPLILPVPFISIVDAPSSVLILLTPIPFVKFPPIKTVRPAGLKLVAELVYA